VWHNLAVRSFPQRRRLPDQKKYTAEMIGEALREAGTLVLVFAPLYVIFEKSNASWVTLLSVLLVGIVLLILGIQVERKRQ
jgi:hypothetical protein